MSDPKISDLGNADKLCIINNWCMLFSIARSTHNSVETLMHVVGFDYPMESYPNWVSALNESYIRAHAHTWSVCCHIENQRKFYDDK